MQQFTTLTSNGVVLMERDIDTDQIIPARYLKGIEKVGLGTNLFADWRFHPDGSLDEGCVLNLPENKQAEILVAGDNFGCGSSREHAVWALIDFGFKVIISTSFADIFRNNALRNGLLTVQLQPEEHINLIQHLQTRPGSQVSIDLMAQSLTFNGNSIQFPIDAFAKTCLLQGVDELGYLISLEEQISRYETEHGMNIRVNKP